jgi:uncharacterized protein (UPF0276 family)
MMDFAINYSTQAADLLKQSKIQLERFKCPDWPDMIAEASLLRPVAVHVNLKAGRGKLKATDWARLATILEQTGTPYLNLHLEARREDFPEIPVDTTDPKHGEQIAEQMIADLRLAAQHFGAERVIGENVPYRGQMGKVLRPATLPEIIRQVLEETGCGLLLDTAHARIAAHYLGMDERQYLATLPVERLRELHFTGVHDLDGYWQDHLSALEIDWLALEWVLERIRSGEWSRPWLLAFEYGGVGEKFAGRSDPQVIIEQVPQLYESVKLV